MKKKSIINHLAAQLICLMGIIGIPGLCAGKSYTVDIDDISRVKVQFLMTETWSYEDADDFHSGLNTVEMSEDVSAIAFSAREGYEIENVHYVHTEGYAAEPGLDGFPRNGIYILYAGSSEWEGAVITVTSREVNMMSATFNIDNASAISVQNSMRESQSIHDGTNTIHFSAIDNPFYVIKMDEEAIMVVKQNGKFVTEGSISLSVLQLEDGDVIEIYTDGSGEDPNDPSLWPDSNTLITSQNLPKTPYVFTSSRSSNAFTPDGEQYVDGLVRSLIMDTSGNQNVYLDNPVTFFDTEAYLLARNNQGVLEIRLPQLIYSKGDTQYWAYRLDATDGGYAINPEVTQIIRVRGEGDGSWQMLSGDGEDFILGYCTTEGEWTGYGDKNMIYASMESEGVTAPRGTSYNPYDFSPENITVSIAISVNNDVYVKGLTPLCPEGTIQGHLENGILSIPTHQYLGINDGWHLYFETISEHGVNTDTLELTYDITDNSFTASEEAGFAIVRGSLIDTPLYERQQIRFSPVGTGIEMISVHNDATLYFYDMAGRQALQPVKGSMYIVKSVNPDGSVTINKIIY